MLNNKRKAKANPKGNRAERRRAVWQEPRRCDEKPTRKSDPHHGKPNPNRRRDEAIKLLNRGGILVRESIQQGKNKAERFFVSINGKRYAVRKKIAGLLLGTRGILERIAAGVRLVCWQLTFLGKSWVAVTL